MLLEIDRGIALKLLLVYQNLTETGGLISHIKKSCMW
jgi:hypothetical protein